MPLRDNFKKKRMKKEKRDKEKEVRKEEPRNLFAARYTLFERSDSRAVYARFRRGVKKAGQMSCFVVFAAAGCRTARTQ